MKRVKKRLIFLSCVMLLVLALIPVAGYSKKKTPINLTVYTETTDYLGTQDGWFAKVLWDKFKVKLKIVNEYEGRSSEQIKSGNWGDICLFGYDERKYLNAVNNGILLDWNKDNLLSVYGKYINTNMPAALEWNKELNKSDKVYGISGNLTSSLEDHSSYFYHPDIRWDLYKQLGYPEVKTLEDWIDILAQMKKICPTSDSGKETYGVSLFSDWDGDSVVFVKSTAALFGYDEYGMGLYDLNKQTWQGNLDNGSMYLRCLKFYNQLYQKDLLDPDSQTQGYEGAQEDYIDGAAFFSIFSYMASLNYNTREHLQQGKAMYAYACEDQKTLTYGLSTYGHSDIWAIGAKTKYPELCMEIINWLYTPEGCMTLEYGPKGLTWDYNSKKQPYLTDLGIVCMNSGNTEMLNSYTGNFIDGRSKINGGTWDMEATNPDSDGETFDYRYWYTYCPQDKSDIFNDWRKFTDKNSIDEYLNSKDHTISLDTQFYVDSRSEDLDPTWLWVGNIIKDYSWRAIYAENDTEFDNIVKEMQEEADDYGYAKCCTFMQEQAAKRKAAEDEVLRRNGVK